MVSRLEVGLLIPSSINSIQVMINYPSGFLEPVERPANADSAASPSDATSPDRAPGGPQVIPLFFGQVLIVFKHYPRILARKRFNRKCCTCLLNSGEPQPRAARSSAPYATEVAYGVTICKANYIIFRVTPRAARSTPACHPSRSDGRARG